MLTLVLAAMLALQDPAAVVQRGVDAMGGTAALRGVRTVSADYYAMTWALGQSETAESPPRGSAATGRVTTDYAGNRRVRTQDTRAGMALNRLRRVTAGGIGYAEAGIDRPVQTVDNPAVVANVERLMRREPDRLLLAALDNPGALTALRPRPWRGQTMDGVRLTMPLDTADLWFERRSGLLTAVEITSDDPVLGDRVTTSYLTRWHRAGDVRWFRQWDVMVNGQQIEHGVNVAVTVNGQVDEAAFAIPDSLASRAQRGPAPAPVITVTMAELAPGVWRAEGGTHHTLVVEQGNQLVLVEAPQSAARTTAVLDTLRSRFPGRRVTTVVNTHHHWDHAGGVRAALAAGLPVVSHHLNDAFIRRVAAAPKTLVPDELSRRRRDPSMRLVTDSLVIGLGDSRIVVYPLATAHADDVLGIWVPSAGVVFTSDVLNPAPNTPLNPMGSSELVAFARSRGLSPQRYAGGHGPVQQWSEVERAAN